MLQSGYGGFIYSFGLKSIADMNKTEGAYLNAVYWVNSEICHVILSGHLSQVTSCVCHCRGRSRWGVCFRSRWRRSSALRSCFSATWCDCSLLTRHLSSLNFLAPLLQIGCLAATLFMYALRHNHVALYVGTCFFGLFLSSSTPTTLALAEQYINISCTFDLCIAHHQYYTLELD